MQTSVLNTPENKQQVYRLHSYTPENKQQVYRLHSYTPELLNSQRNYTIPCASMALATFMKPATLAPFT